MSEKLIVHAPINQLSLGNVSYNILRELYKKKINVIFFPKQFDLSAFNPTPEFKTWLENSINSRYTKYNKSIPTFSTWHIAGSEFKLSDKQYLLTFHETDSPQPAEVNIVNQQEKTFFTSNWSKDNFERYEGERLVYIPLGLDQDFKILPKKNSNSSIIQWLIGPYKFESRKCTQSVIELWLKKYGNNPKHMLNVAVTNPFFQKMNGQGFDTNDVLQQLVFKGKNYSNINIIPYLKTNLEVNSLINACDISLAGISKSEAWNIPAFTAASLGKQVIVSNVSGHQSWCNSDNSILLEADGMEPCYDSQFFRPGEPFNQGNFYKFSSDAIISCFEMAESKAKDLNTSGLELQKMSYSNTVDLILKEIYG